MERYKVIEKKKILKGQKYDTGKLRWNLIPFDCLSEIIRVLMHGAKKYSEYGWKKVPRAKERYFSAAMRHLTSWWQGEKIDRESGLNHLAHAGCCLLFLMWHDKKEL